jgi:type II secretory pathway component PulF
MKLDEFAFFNQQLAAMLRDGIPLESALGQLCSSMRRGELREELEKLRADLANGTPIKQALTARKLPPFYVQMIQVGVQSNDLPGILTLVADYYRSGNLIWTRLKGLMVYPVILLVGLFGASIVMAVVLGIMRSGFADINHDLLEGRSLPGLTQFYMEYGVVIFWTPVIIFAMALLAAAVTVSLPSMRQKWRWRLPAFREASLWQCASAMQVMLQGGCTLNQAIALLGELERGSPAAAELGRWQQRLGDGHAQFREVVAGSDVFPPLFLWIVGNAREELAEGFRQAAEIYRQRAAYRMEAFLYAVLPTSVIVMGLAICLQVFLFVLAGFMPLVSVIGSLGG